MTARWWCLVLLWLAGAAHAEIRIDDDRGATVRLAAPPARIVSLLPSLTESVCALGGCSRLVGVDRFSNEPASVRALPKLGGIDDAQVEAIAALHPDIVLAAPSARAVDSLAALGIPVLVLESRNHADVKRTLGLLARLLGTPDRAAALWAQIDAQIRAAAAQVPADVRGQRVYFEVDTGPYGAGASSFIGETLARLGMANVLPAELGPFPKLNPEYVVRLQPDIVIAMSPELASMAERPGWTAMRALQARRTCGFAPATYEVLIRPGPRMGEAAALLAGCLAGLPKLP
jgi:iron complex transport system substrate-binding protein